MRTIWVTPRHSRTSRVPGLSEIGGGFIPGTKREGGYPIDALAGHEGGILPCRPLGGVDLVQEGAKGPIENPRLLLPIWHDRMGELENAADLPARLKAEIEQFFLSATFFYIDDGGSRAANPEPAPQDRRTKIGRCSRTSDSIIPLLTPQWNVVLALLSPLGLGVALMAIASPSLNGLFWIGFAISLLGAAGTISLFFDDLRRIRLVIHGAVLTIRPITLELVAIIAIIFLELAVPLSIYGYVAGKDRSAIVAQLQKCYIEVGPIITRPLPKDISEADFNKYIEEANAWVNNCANWIGENIGTPARERFMDRTGGSAGFIFGAANKKHSDIILALTRFRQNLIGLIENGAWDK